MAQPCNYTLDFFSQLSRANRHRVRQSCRFAHFCYVQPQFQRRGGELPLGHDGVHLCAQWRLCGLGWLEHSSYWRMPKHRHWFREFLAWQLGHYGQRLLHVHPESHLRTQWLRVWSVTIQNAWTGAATATYDLDIVFTACATASVLTPKRATLSPPPPSPTTISAIRHRLPSFRAVRLRRQLLLDFDET